MCSGIRRPALPWSQSGSEPLVRRDRTIPICRAGSPLPSVPKPWGHDKAHPTHPHRGDRGSPWLLPGLHAKPSASQSWREGLTDPRGALTIKFVETIDAIDLVRTHRSEPSASPGGRTFQASSRTRKRLRLLPRSPGGRIEELQPPGANGRTLVVCMDPSEQPRGGFWMPNISACPTTPTCVRYRKCSSRIRSMRSTF